MSEEEIKNEKTPIIEWDMQAPKEAYIYGVRGKIGTLYSKFYFWAICAIAMIGLLMIIFDKKPYFFFGWGLLAFGVSILIIMVVVNPSKMKKYHEKLSAAKEDIFHHKFYDDYVNIKNPTVEGNLQYKDAEFFTENDKILMLVFPFKRSIIVDKTKCNDEQLEFLRNVVPKENQEKTVKSYKKKYIARSIFITLFVLWLVLVLVSNVAL